MIMISIRRIILLIITIAVMSFQTYGMHQSTPYDKVMAVQIALAHGFNATALRKPPAQIMQHYEKAKEIILSWPDEERTQLLNARINEIGYTTLHSAITLGSPLDFIKFLIHHGSDMNLPENMTNQTSIMLITTILEDPEAFQLNTSSELTHNYTEIFQYLASLPETNINTYLRDPLRDSLLIKTINLDNINLISSLFCRCDLIIPPELIFKYIDEQKYSIVRIIIHTNLIQNQNPLTTASLPHTQIDLTGAQRLDIPFTCNSLHTLATIGNHKLIKQAYQWNPEWAIDLDQDGDTPLHVIIKKIEQASNHRLFIMKESYLKTIEALLLCNPRLVHVINTDGLTAIQLAERCNVSNEFATILAKVDPLGTIEYTETKMRQKITESYEQEISMFVTDIAHDKKTQIRNTERRIAGERHEHEQILITQQRVIRQEEIAGRQAIKVDKIREQLPLLEPCEHLRRETINAQEHLALKQLQDLKQTAHQQALEASLTGLVERETSARRVTEVEEGRAFRPITKEHIAQHTAFLETLRVQEESRLRAAAQAEEARIAAEKKAANRTRLAERRKQEEELAERVKQEQKTRETARRAEELRRQEEAHPLYAAIHRQNIDSVTRLIDSDRSLVNKHFIFNDEDYTPLKLAIFLENVKIVKTLVKAGAVVNPEGTFRSPIFEYASKLYHHRNIQDPTEKIRKEEILKILRFKILRLSPKK